MKNFIKSVYQKPNFWLYHIAGWTILAIGMKFFYSDKTVNSVSTFFRFYVTYLIGFLLTLVLRYVYRVIYVRRKSILSIISWIVVFSTLALILWEPIDVIVSLPFWEEGELESFFDTYQPFTVLRYYKLNFLWYMFILVWSVLYFGIKTWYIQIEERVKAKKAIALANQAQLQMLRYQINPHFLFNTLNSIKALVRRESALAETMITELSEFLRYTLRHNDKTTISLEEEIEIVRKYLLLEKIRYEKRLNYTFDIDEKCLKVNVLCFLLQPFVENAIKHGLANSPKGINVEIRSYIVDSDLYLQVNNTGRWQQNKNSGSGIKNVQERLDAAYPGKYEFTIDKGDNEVSVTIAIKGVV
jgi:sensor histidine kinase YesM